jgi:phospholipid-binding lipoprotein MlaA
MTTTFFCPVRLLAVLVLAALTGCASLPHNTHSDPRDPFERGNRAVFSFNQQLDRAVARPVARAYARVVPRPIRSGLDNVLQNASYPRVIVSQLLQGKMAATGRDTGRLLVNTIMGLGGLFDVATDIGLDRHDEDFGQALGKWGIPSGPYLMLPLLGPSSMRDAFAEIPDQLTNATHYINDSTTRYGVAAFRLLNDRVNLLEGDALLTRAADPYVFVRSAWLQHREYKVRDGDVGAKPQDFEDPEPDAPEPAEPLKP